jgi:hypothetical protein
LRERVGEVIRNYIEWWEMLWSDPKMPCPIIALLPKKKQGEV